jgi:ornithine carbamoyltransferase
VSAKHYLTGLEMTPPETQGLLELAHTLKKERDEGVTRRDLAGKHLALLFEKPSLRTHVSFTVAMQEVGGTVIDSFSFNRKKEEPEDVARVLAGYCHAIMLRTHEHSTLERMASKLRVPLINGLSDSHHPCQVLADLMTLRQSYGDLKGVRLAYVGDGNNMLHSLLLLAPAQGVHLSYACPAGYEPSALVLAEAMARAAESGGSIIPASQPIDAVKGAQAIYTDVWTSMGFEKEELERQEAFRGFQVNAELYAHAAPGAVLMHCLPMERGKEITGEMAEHERSVLFQQSENRLHVQKALLLMLLKDSIH